MRTAPRKIPRAITGDRFAFIVHQARTCDTWLVGAPFRSGDLEGRERCCPGGRRAGGQIGYLRLAVSRHEAGVGRAGNGLWIGRRAANGAGRVESTLAVNPEMPDDEEQIVRVSGR